MQLGIEEAVVRRNGSFSPGGFAEAAAAHEHGREGRRRAPLVAAAGGEHRAGAGRRRALPESRVLPQGIRLLPRYLRVFA